MRNIRTSHLLALISVMALVLSFFLLPAHASYIDFVVDPGSGSNTGTFSYLGGPNPLIASSIEVDKVVGVNTPLNPGPPALVINSGALNFTTGNLTGSDTTNWYFGSNPSLTSITITGDIPALGLTGATLMQGSITSANVSKLAGSFKVSLASFIDYKNKTLTDYYGLPNGAFPYVGSLNISFTATGSPPDPFTSTGIGSGDIQNAPVPEPATLFLLGFGLVGIAGYAWRRKKKQS